MDKAYLKFFADYIFENLGIVYQDENMYQLGARLEEIKTQMGYGDVQELYEKSKSGISGKLKGLLLDAATNNETSFFRDPEVFKAFENTLRLSIKEGKKIFNIWSAACSKGQEPYSLAMIAHQLGKEFSGLQIRIQATDVSDRVLEYAKKGEYSQLEVGRGLAIDKKNENFDESKLKDQSVWVVKPHLRRFIDFRKLNLIEELPVIGPFDYLFCRNVLIYQKIERKKQIIGKMEKLLNPGGFFVLGGAESMIGLSDNFKMEKIDNAIFNRYLGVDRAFEKVVGA